MTGNQGQWGKDRQAARFARYCALRDDGERPTDAAREIGLANTFRYERSYRQLRGLPPGETWPNLRK